MKFCSLAIIALAISSPAYASNVGDEVDHYVTMLKRLCIDSRLSADVALQQWREAGATKEIRVTPLAERRAEFGAGYDRLVQQPGGMDGYPVMGKTRDQYIDSILGDRGDSYSGIAIMGTPHGKEFYTFTAETRPGERSFVSCTLALTFSSLPAAVQRIEKALSLSELERFPGRGDGYWKRDPYDGLQFSTDDLGPYLDGYGSFLIEVTPAALTN